MKSSSLLLPTMENVRIELARRNLQYRELWEWADRNKMYMAYNQLTAYIREDNPLTHKAQVRIAKMFNGLLAEKSEPPVFDEDPPDF